MGKSISNESEQFDFAEEIQAAPRAGATASRGEEEILEQVRAHVHQASQLLKSLDADRARVGWLLEDALMYLEEMDADALFDRIEPLDIDQAIMLPRTISTVSK